MDVYKVTSNDLYIFSKRKNILKNNFFKNDLGLVDATFCFYLSKNKEKVLINTKRPCFNNNFQELILFLKENLFLKSEMEVKLNVEYEVDNNLLLVNNFHETFENNFNDNDFPKDLFNHKIKENKKSSSKNNELYLSEINKKKKIEKDEALRIIQGMRDFKQEDIKIIEKVLKK